MGCACVAKLKEIQPNDIDLSEEQTKVHQNTLINDINLMTKKISESIIEVQNYSSSNLKILNKSKNKNIKKKPKKSISLNISNNFDYSGPIITLLKNRVDSYHLKKSENNF